mgnify:CR=1 FL=1
MVYNEWTGSEVEEYIHKRVPHGFLDVLYDSENIKPEEVIRKAMCLEKVLKKFGQENSVVAAKSNLRKRPAALILLEQIYVKYLSQ